MSVHTILLTSRFNLVKIHHHHWARYLIGAAPEWGRGLSFVLPTLELRCFWFYFIYICINLFIYLKRC